MTDPVVPPQHGAPSYPPPNAGGQGYPAPNAGGQGFPAPNAGGQGYPPPNTGGQGFPPPQAGGFAPLPPPNTGGPGYPPPAAASPFEQEPKKKGFKKLLGIGGGLGVAIVVLVLKFGIGAGIGAAVAEDKTADAKAGSCIAVKQTVTEKTTEVDAETVDCGSADAKFSVVGRVEGTTDLNSTACDKYFKETDEAALLQGGEGKDGYLLCVVTKKS